VLTHPRCINCHTATNYPQQGDDRHRHLFNIIRGPGGKGVAGLNCVTSSTRRLRWTFTSCRARRNRLDAASRLSR
jgi:hypothetical protein